MKPTSRLISSRRRLSTQRESDPQRGFSLVEVLVALIICSVGLLGLAKMESLALSSTGVASARSLVALEAASLGAAMHANPGFWAAGSALASTTITKAGTSSAAVISDSRLQASGGCLTVATSCNPTLMAAFDLQAWAVDLGNIVPYNLTTIVCSTATNVPVSCTITVQWVESNIVANNNAQTNFNPSNPTYVLYVQP